MRRKPRIHFIERVIGNAKRGEDLLARSLAPADFFGMTPSQPATQQGGQYQRCGKALPKHRLTVQPLCAPKTSLLNQSAFQAGGCRPPFARLTQFAFEFVYWFRLHSIAPCS